MNNLNKTLYITTPIYYANDNPHIGHAYTTILADAVVRYGRLFGRKTWFLTGTDEHGQKVQKAAERSGISPEEYCDNVAEQFQVLWQKLNISNDDFLRTTQERHISAVRNVLNALFEQGDIYKGTYTDWYCIPCERFFADADLTGGRCPDCGNSVEKLDEEGYFFRLSKYQDWLLDYINDNQEFIQPEFRRNETLGFLRRPLNDLCISRPKSRISWGIELPFDHEFVCYVWFEALLNYISAAGYPSYRHKFDELWPADYHLLGKDILTQHTVYWPCILKALNLDLPRVMLAHGWWLNEGQKISKSKGNAIDFEAYITEFGVDAFRYFVLAEMTSGQDASFSRERFIEKYNTDLANNLGNLASRIIRLIHSETGGIITDCSGLLENDIKFQNNMLQIIPSVEKAAFDLKINSVIDCISSGIRSCNQYLERTEPWKLKNDPSKRNRLSTILYTALEGLRIVSGLLYPVIPGKAVELRRLIGVNEKDIIPDINRLKEWGLLGPGKKIGESVSLFPRIE